ncbi:MAG: ribosome assembly RNA-binding protein YhbY [Burkholderiaceae bacterium]|jgi:putative YhbY family RNA-binding protein|nr:ribosome assembly RNA-binding protein YhbY [Burkholderiaceae bacterium]
MPELTTDERLALRKQAHSLSPVVIVGSAGLTEGVLKEIDKSLNAHGLIKVRVFSDERTERDKVYQAICARSGAAPIQHIGKLLVIYRPKKERTTQPAAGKHASPAPTPGISPHRTRKPPVKSNVRAASGGKIKRSRVRQTSLKKRGG